MPERSSYVAGTPCWVDVSSEDLDATIVFYTGLFGWEAVRPTEPEAGGYTLRDPQGVEFHALCPRPIE